MAYGIASTYAKTEDDFIKPPEYATWCKGNFIIHKDLVQLKSWVTRTQGYVLGRDDVHIYQWKRDEWVRIHTVPVGSNPRDHVLWKSASKRGAKQVELAQEKVDAAIESILKSAGKEDE